MSDVIQAMDFPAGSVGFDVDAFDAKIQAHGVDLVHFRAMRNPVGLTDRDDSRRPDGEIPGASNGNIYTEVGCFTGLLIGNSKEVKAYAGGILDSSTAQITAPRFYSDSTTKIYLKPEDRLYLREPAVLVVKEELVNAHTSGVDRLRFPVAEVLDLVDSTAQRYRYGSDFTHDGGVITWGSRRPGVDPATNKGRVYSVVYLTRPYWYFVRFMHEIRVAQVEDALGVRGITQMPQAGLIYREFVHRGSENSDLAQPTSRQAQAPADSGFGPR